HDGRTVRVTATRPIDCEHARGPAFLLSDKDKSALSHQLARDQRDPCLAGLIAVGWYLSHTRSEITLNEPDLEIYSTFFPATWQPPSPRAGGYGSAPARYSAASVSAGAHARAPPCAAAAPQMAMAGALGRGSGWTGVLGTALCHVPAGKRADLALCGRA